MEFYFWKSYKKDKAFCTNDGAEVILNLMTVEFLLDVPIIVPVRARQAFCCMDSNFSLDKVLNAWSKRTSSVYKSNYKYKYCN